MRTVSYARLSLIACVLLWRALGVAPIYAAEASALSEYAVKAAFIYNFAKYTEWPASTFGTPRDPVVLCVFASDAYGPALGTIDGRPVQGRTMRVRRSVRPDELKSCQMLFVAESDERRVPELMRAVKGSPVLTMSDSEGFAEAGGMIGLVNTGERVQLQINHDATQRSGLKVSSQLLNLAKLVKDRR
jgi:YfiR/HmsC-like